MHVSIDHGFIIRPVRCVCHPTMHPDDHMSIMPFKNDIKVAHVNRYCIPTRVINSETAHCPVEIQYYII